MNYGVDITVTGTQGPIFAPAGLSSPAAVCLGCTVTGGSVKHLTEPSSGQTVLLVSPDAAEVTFRYDYANQSGAYPEAIFHPAASRHTLAAQALCDEAMQTAGDGDALTRAIRVARGVAEKFVYGHPQAKYYDGFDHVPHLASGLTEGSCVDIHTYLLASLRAIGVEAGYVTGNFGMAACWTCRNINPLDQAAQDVGRLGLVVFVLQQGLKVVDLAAVEFAKVGVDLEFGGWVGLI